MKFNISLYLMFVFVGEIITYEFKCPDALQRTIRVKTVCVEKSSDRYSCLLDEHTDTYMESCIEPADFVRPGQKYVIRVYPKNTNCNTMRYQPFKFWSNELSKCVFSKSKCNEVGQIIYNISSPSIDNDCRCDHTRGYAFLHMPKQSCYCTPTQEDCTCYKKLCPSDYSLASDYQCRSALSGPSTCTDVKIDKPVVNLTKTGKEPINVQDIDYINKITEISRIQTTMVIFVAAIMMFSVVAIIHNKHKIKEQLVCLEYNALGSTTTTVDDTSTADTNMEKLTKDDNDTKIHETIASENLLPPSQQEVHNKHKIKGQLVCLENNDLGSTTTTVDVHNKHKIKEQLVCLEYNALGSTTTTVDDTSAADTNMEKLTKYDNDKKIHETIASENLLPPSPREGKEKSDACLDRIQFYGRYTL